MGVTVTQLIQEVIAECVRPVSAYIVADSAYIHEAASNRLSGSEEVEVVSEALLVDVPAEDPIVRRHLIVGAPHRFNIIEWRRYRPARGRKLDRHAEHVDGLGCAKCQAARLYACRTDCR